jgi:glucose/arabinose dehydrogenase
MRILIYFDRFAKTGAQLNHGIQLTPDGKTLFASTVDKVFSWSYDATQKKTMSEPLIWVEGMRNSDHTTRTLLLSKQAPGQLLVSRGSGSNLDYRTLDINSGISQIRAFDVSSPPKKYKYTDGKVIGWGLRNSIGIDEHPITGGIWSNENGSDDMKRDGKDIHETSPGNYTMLKFSDIMSIFLISFLLPFRGGNQFPWLSQWNSVCRTWS